MTVEPIVGARTQIDGAFWLKAAHGSVRRECEWHVAPVITETITLDGPGGTSLLIPSKRVVELVEVLNDGENITDRVDTSKAGILEIRGGRWTTRLGRISITLRHGYELEEVPEVAALILSLAKRGAASGLYASQSANGASVSYLTAGGAPLSIPLLQIEKNTLGPYRVNWGA